MGLSRILVCEGPSDKEFFERLIQQRNLPKFYIHHTGGRHETGGNSKFDQRLLALRPDPKHPNFRGIKDILIVSDNDDAPEQRFALITEQIERVFGRGSAPRRPMERTLATPSISILMIPGGDEHGCLECICQTAARNSDRALSNQIDHFFALIGADRWVNESRKGKAWLRVNLALRSERNPFIHLKKIFQDARHQHLIPVSDRSFNGISDYLASLEYEVAR